MCASTFFTSDTLVVHAQSCLERAVRAQLSRAGALPESPMRVPVPSGEVPVDGGPSPNTAMRVAQGVSDVCVPATPRLASLPASQARSSCSIANAPTADACAPVAAVEGRRDQLTSPAPEHTCAAEDRAAPPEPIASKCAVTQTHPGLRSSLASRTRTVALERSVATSLGTLLAVRPETSHPARALKSPRSLPRLTTPSCIRCTHCGGCATHLFLCAGTDPVEPHRPLQADPAAPGAPHQQACATAHPWLACALFVPAKGGRKGVCLPPTARRDVIRSTADDVRAAFAQVDDTARDLRRLPSRHWGTNRSADETSSSFSPSRHTSTQTLDSTETGGGYDDDEADGADARAMTSDDDCMLTASSSSVSSTPSTFAGCAGVRVQLPVVPPVHGSVLPCPIPLVTVLHGLFMQLTRLETRAYVQRAQVDGGDTSPRADSRRHGSGSVWLTTAAQPAQASLYEAVQQQSLPELGLIARAVWERLCFITGLPVESEVAQPSVPYHGDYPHASPPLSGRLMPTWRDVPFLVVVTPFHTATASSPTRRSAPSPSLHGRCTHSGGLRLFVPEDFFVACASHVTGTSGRAVRHSWTGWPPLPLAGRDSAQDGRLTTSPSRTWWDTVFRPARLLCARRAARHTNRRAAHVASGPTDHPDEEAVLLFHRQVNRPHGGYTADIVRRCQWDLLALLVAETFRHHLVSPLTQRRVCVRQTNAPSTSAAPTQPSSPIRID